MLPSSRQLPSSSRQLPPSSRQLPPSSRQLLRSARQLLRSARQLLPSARQLLRSLRQLLRSANRLRPTWKRLLPTWKGSFRSRNWPCLERKHLPAWPWRLRHKPSRLSGKLTAFPAIAFQLRCRAIAPRATKRVLCTSLHKTAPSSKSCHPEPEQCSWNTGRAGSVAAASSPPVVPATSSSPRKRARRTVSPRDGRRGRRQNCRRRGVAATTACRQLHRSGSG